MKSNSTKGSDKKATKLRALVRITEVSKREDGQYNVHYQIDRNFKERFKELQGLRRWSKKRFEKWFSENVNEIIKSQKELKNGKEKSA